MKKAFFLCALIFLISSGGVSQSNGARAGESRAGSNMKSDLRHNPWSLIVYRSENDFRLNDIRSYVKITDEEGNDAFEVGENGAPKAKAFYEWVSEPGVYYGYQRKPYLRGGMALHLNLKKGKYKISVYTPEEDLEYFEGNAKGAWVSDEFLYDTENPLKVIFVYPDADENGFYSGKWYVSWKAPKWWKFTRPVM